MQAEIVDFLNYIRSEKGLAKNTILAYKHDVESLVKFLESKNIQTFSEVLPSHLIDFLGQMKAASYSPQTIHRMLIATKVFMRFLKREGVIIEDPASTIETQKLWQRLPDILSPKEIEALLRQTDCMTYEGARDRAIIELLYSSGLRVSELCQLDIYAVDDQSVRVKGKGGKERLVPIGSKALQAIDEFLLRFRDHFDSQSETRLFLSKTGKPMNRTTVWKRVKHYAKKAGIVKTISPHSFRHAFATHLLDHGADLRVIQEMLGHSSITSTDRYTQVSRSRMQMEFERCHPSNTIFLSKGTSEIAGIKE